MTKPAQFQERPNDNVPSAKTEGSLRGVARRAGVSVSTVSNVMNGRSERVAPQTFNRVVESIRALNYQPSHAARMLRTGHTPMLGLLVPSIDNPFFSSLARELDQAAQKRGYRLLMGNSDRDPEKEHAFLEKLMRYGARGAITTSELGEQNQYAPLIARGLSIVSLDRRASPDFTLSIDYVSIDNVHVAYAATRHLLERGHTAVAYATAPVRTLSRIDRRAGYQAAMKDAGLEDAATVTEFEAAVFVDSELPEVGRRVA